MVYDVYIQNLQGPDTVYPNFKVGTLGTVKVRCVFSTFSRLYSEAATRGVL